MATLKPSLALLLCMLAFLRISPVVPAQGAVESDDKKFFYLNLLWPGSYCNSKKCCIPTTGEPKLDFFVESMELYDSNSGTAVTNCNSTCNFNVNQLKDFKPDMYSHWPDVKCPSNTGKTMWKSTFCKYGPCSSLNQTYYFQQALNFRKDLDLLKLFESEDIKPSKTAQYYLEDFELALMGKLPEVSFVVECIRKPNFLLFAETQLLRIKICISANGTNIINCPIYKKSNCQICPFFKKSNCDSRVKFLPFTNDMLGQEPSQTFEL